MRRSPITVLVTSAGTASGVNVIKALKRQEEMSIRIVGVDADPLAAGPRLSDMRVVVPLASDDSYVPSLLDIVRREGVDVVIPIYSREIELLASRQAAFGDAGARMLVSRPESIKRCNNKREMAGIAESLGMRCPRIFSDIEVASLLEEKFPLFIKPPEGSSSAGARKVTSRKQLDFWMQEIPGLLVQEFIEGYEVTVDLLSNQDAEPVIIAARKRLATKLGQSVKGITVDCIHLHEQIGKLLSTLEVVGPSNMQFMISPEGPVFIEINPRYAAGGLMLTVESGANLPLQAVKLALGYPVNQDDCRTRPGVVMSRYWEEVFWSQ